MPLAKGSRKSHGSVHEISEPKAEFISSKIFAGVTEIYRKIFQNLLLLLNQQLRIVDTLKVAFGIVEALMDQIALAFIELLLASRFALVEVMPVDLIAEISQDKISNNSNARKPNDESNEMKHKRRVKRRELRSKSFVEQRAYSERKIFLTLTL